MKNDSLAYIVYYSGAYGDTIRIATKSIDWITLFRDKIVDIFNGNILGFDICQMPHIKCFDSVSSLDLVRVNKCSTPCIVLKHVNGKNTFTWAQDLEEIETLIGLVDGLVKSNKPGHQYLACEDDGCVLELSYNEE